MNKRDVLISGLAGLLALSPMTCEQSYAKEPTRNHYNPMEVYRTLPDYHSVPAGTPTTGQTFTKPQAEFLAGYFKALFAQPYKGIRSIGKAPQRKHSK